MADIEISLKAFTNFAVALATKQISAVEEAKERFRPGAPQYDARTNFYHPLEERIDRMHGGNLPWTYLEQLPGEREDLRKKNHYPGLIDNYRDEWERRGLTYFTPGFANWEYNGVKIRAWARVGGSDGIHKYAIRPWYNTDPPGIDRLSVMLGIFHLAKAHHWPDDYIPVIWDVRRKVFHQQQPQPYFELLLQGMVNNFRSMWEALP